MDLPLYKKLYNFTPLAVLDNDLVKTDVKKLQRCTQGLTEYLLARDDVMKMVDKQLKNELESLL
jgi:hypothetical protein